MLGQRHLWTNRLHRCLRCLFCVSMQGARVGPQMAELNVVLQHRLLREKGEQAERRLDARN